MRSDWRDKRARKLLQRESVPLAALLHVGDVFRLSCGEVRAVGYLASGYSLQETAEEMHISEGACRTYVKRALQHTYTHSQAQLVRLVYRAAQDLAA